jgi:hypothetical protein
MPELFYLCESEEKKCKKILINAAFLNRKQYAFARFLGQGLNSGLGKKRAWHCVKSRILRRKKPLSYYSSLHKQVRSYGR